MCRRLRNISDAPPRFPVDDLQVTLSARKLHQAGVFREPVKPGGKRGLAAKIRNRVRRPAKTSMRMSSALSGRKCPNAVQHVRAVRVPDFLQGLDVSLAGC